MPIMRARREIPSPRNSSGSPSRRRPSTIPMVIYSCRRVSECLDYEVELVFVVGKRCKHVDRAGAKAAIFGFTVGNDTSVRDWQSKTSQVILGKSFDSHAPMVLGS